MYIAKSKSSFVWSTNGRPAFAACALFITISIFPYSSTVLFITFLTSSSIPPSAGIARTLTPYSFSSFALAFSNLDTVLPVTIILAPSLA